MRTPTALCIQVLILVIKDMETKEDMVRVHSRDMSYAQPIQITVGLTVHIVTCGTSIDNRILGYSNVLFRESVFPNDATVFFILLCTDDEILCCVV